ncbi:MAG: thermonuclease family protein [Aestuariivirga sp.]|uniref:thermonuclease family protein n=1 Tax=Aestuariivirga sp. TaxID=2650926 RepID=UPI0030197163
MRGIPIAVGLLAGLLLASAIAFGAPLVQGTASVIDGDTIEIHGQRIRLDAIDAPESSQLCLDAAGKRYRCGQKSAFALADMIGRSSVACEPKGRDRYQRIIAVCFKGDTNLNAWMVAQGWAVAFRKYGIDYIPQEDDARLNRSGMWAGSFDMPWDWRARKR